MNRPILAAISLLLSTQALADEGYVSFGVGVANSAKRSRGETKVVDLGMRQELYQGIYFQTKLGFYGDGSGDPGRKSSGYGSLGLGMLIDLRPIEMRAGYGVAAITTPDSYLGGRFVQFQGEAYVGVRDHRGNGLGFAYEHISSAGLCTPNKGRDFLVLQLSQQW